MAENAPKEREAWADAARAFGRYREEANKDVPSWTDAWAATTAALIAYEAALRK